MPHPKYLIKDGEEAAPSGPFSVDELGAMAKKGSITPESLIRPDGGDQDWVSIRDEKNLASQLFPPRKVPVLKKPATPPEAVPIEEPADAPREGSPGRTPPRIQSKAPPSEKEEPGQSADVKEILAASSGAGTAAGRRALRRERFQRWAVSLTTPSLVLGLLLGAAAFGISERAFIEEAWESFEISSWLHQPAVLLATLDLLFAVLLFLGAHSLFPLIRIRSMAVLGFFGFHLYSTGQLDLLAGLAASCLGLFGITLSLRLKTVLLFAMATFCGAGYLLWRAVEGATFFQTLP